MRFLSVFRSVGYAQQFKVGCTIEVEHTANSLHAHVTLDDDVEIRPGDAVTIHGEPVRPGFGDKFTLRREATVQRAGWLTAMWTRLVARLELTELCETSFSEWRKV